MSPPQAPDISHVALTVSDLDASKSWYTELLGREPILDEDTGPYRHVAYQFGATLLSLHGFPDLTTTAPFDERRPGLDHVAFGCASRSELVRWQKRIEELRIRHGGIVDAPTGSGLSFRDPDNIALEFFSWPEENA